MHYKKALAVSLAFLGCGASQGAFAAESDAWHYEVTPYLFAAAMNGKSGVRGVTADLDVSFSDILDNLDQGFMGLFTASKGPWTYGLEAVYMKLDDHAAKNATGPFGHVSVRGALRVTSEMYVYQGSVAYRVMDETTAVDLVGGLRYTKLELDAKATLTTTPGIVFPGGSRRASGSESWTDAVIGVRAAHPVSDKLTLIGYADVGGGGSDFTYQIIVGADWAFSKDFIAKAGYRQLSWDYESGGTKWDVRASGPYLGLGIRF